MFWQRIWGCCRTILRWIILALCENASTYQSMFWAVVYKATFAAAMYMFYAPQTRDMNTVSEELMKEMEGVTEKLEKLVGVKLSVEEYKVFAMVICFVAFVMLLVISYILIRWDRKVASMKVVLGEERWEEWKLDNMHWIYWSFWLKYIILPSVWPLLCCFVGTEAKRFSSLLILGLLAGSYLAFIFRHRSDEDLNVIDTIVAIQASIIYNCYGDRCHEEWYMWIIVVVLPIIVRRALPLLLKIFWVVEDPVPVEVAAVEGQRGRGLQELSIDMALTTRVGRGELRSRH